MGRGDPHRLVDGCRHREGPPSPSSCTLFSARKYTQSLPKRSTLRFDVRWRPGCRSQFLHGEQGALLAASQLVQLGAGLRLEALRLNSGDGRSASRRSVRQVPARKKSDSRTPVSPYLKKLLNLILTGLTLGYEAARDADHGRGPRAGGLLASPRRQSRSPLLRSMDGRT